MNGSISLDKGSIEDLLELAQTLFKLPENRQWQKKSDTSKVNYHGIEYDSLDNLALNIFEKRTGLIIVGITFNGGLRPKLKAIPGWIEKDGTYHDYRTYGKDFEQNPIDVHLPPYHDLYVARFAIAASELVNSRAKSPNPRISNSMIADSLQQSYRARSKVMAYMQK